MKYVFEFPNDFTLSLTETNHGYHIQLADADTTSTLTCTDSFTIQLEFLISKDSKELIKYADFLFFEGFNLEYIGCHSFTKHIEVLKDSVVEKLKQIQSYTWVLDNSLLGADFNLSVFESSITEVEFVTRKDLKHSASIILHPRETLCYDEKLSLFKRFKNDNISIGYHKKHSPESLRFFLHIHPPLKTLHVMNVPNHLCESLLDCDVSELETFLLIKFNDNQSFTIALKNGEFHTLQYTDESTLKKLPILSKFDDESIKSLTHFEDALTLFV